MYEIETEDFYKDISADVKDQFDTCNYPSDHSSGIPVGVNKKVLGMMNDEAGCEIIDEFVGLRQKCIRTRCKREKKVNKRTMMVLYRPPEYQVVKVYNSCEYQIS